MCRGVKSGCALLFGLRLPLPLCPFFLLRALFFQALAFLFPFERLALGFFFFFPARFGFFLIGPLVFPGAGAALLRFLRSLGGALFAFFLIYGRLLMLMGDFAFPRGLFARRVGGLLGFFGDLIALPDFALDLLGVGFLLAGSDHAVEINLTGIRLTTGYQRFLPAGGVFAGVGFLRCLLALRRFVLERFGPVEQLFALFGRDGCDGGGGSRFLTRSGSVGRRGFLSAGGLDEQAKQDEQHGLHGDSSKKHAYNTAFHLPLCALAV